MNRADARRDWRGASVARARIELWRGAERRKVAAALAAREISQDGAYTAERAVDRTAAELRRFVAFYGLLRRIRDIDGYADHKVDMVGEIARLAPKEWHADLNIDAEDVAAAADDPELILPKWLEGWPR